MAVACGVPARCPGGPACSDESGAGHSRHRRERLLRLARGACAQPIRDVAVARRPIALVVMIEKFAAVRGLVRSEFLDLNHTSKPMILVSLMIAKFAPKPSVEHRRTSKSGH